MQAIEFSGFIWQENNINRPIQEGLMDVLNLIPHDQNNFKSNLLFYIKLYQLVLKLSVELDVNQAADTLWQSNAATTNINQGRGELINWHMGHFF